MKMNTSEIPINLSFLTRVLLIFLLNVETKKLNAIHRKRMPSSYFFLNQYVGKNWLPSSWFQQEPDEYNGINEKYLVTMNHETDKI